MTILTHSRVGNPIVLDDEAIASTCIAYGRSTLSRRKSFGVRAHKIESVSQQFCVAQSVRRAHRIGIVCHVQVNAKKCDYAAIALQRISSFNSVNTALLGKTLD